MLFILMPFGEPSQLKPGHAPNSEGEANGPMLVCFGPFGFQPPRYASTGRKGTTNLAILGAT